MVKPKNIFIAFIIVSLGIFVAVRLFPSEQKRVRKQFALLAKSVSRKLGENPITTASKVQKVRTLLAENCSLRTHIPEFSGGLTGEEVCGLIAQARLQFSNLSVKFYDLEIEFPEEKMAKATLTVNVAGTMTDGVRIDETHELECVLKKIENKWLFSECEVVEVPKR
jgi:hypothetical protein